MTITRALSSQWLATVYVAGVSMLMTFLLGRLFGPEAFGRYSYIITLASIFAILQDGGFRTFIYRELTAPSFQLTQEKLFAVAHGHVIAVTVAGVFVLSVYPWQDRWSLMIAVLSFGLATTTNFVSSYLKGEGKFDREAWWRVLTRSVTAAGILFFIFMFSLKVEWVLIGWIVGFIIVLAWQSEYSLKRAPAFEWNRQIYTSIAALVAIDVATLIYFKIDLVMLRHMTDKLDQVGYYAAASRMLEGMILVLMPFGTVFFRDLRLRAAEPGKLVLWTGKLLLLAGAAVVLIAPVGWFFGKELLVFCFGPSYAQGQEIIQWLFMALVFMIPNLFLTQSALAINQENYYAIGTCGAALLNIGLNLYLIPLYGAMGAVIGTITTEGFLTVFLATGIFSWYAKQREVKS